MKYVTSILDLECVDFQAQFYWAIALFKYGGESRREQIVEYQNLCKSCNHLFSDLFKYMPHLTWE